MSSTFKPLAHSFSIPGKFNESVNAVLSHRHVKE